MHTLWQEIRQVDTSPKALRSFGLVVGAACVVLAAVLWWRHDWTWHAAEIWISGTGISLAVLGLLVPRLLTPLYRVWMGLALVLGFIMTRVLLTLVYYLLITPIGFLRRHLGEDPMRRTHDPEADSYWIPKEYPNDTPERLEKYF